MKVTFKYSGLVSGECVVETDDFAALVSLSPTPEAEELEENPTKNIDERSNIRFLITRHLDVDYPLISSCARSFYSNMLQAELEIRDNTVSNTDDDEDSGHVIGIATESISPGMLVQRYNGE